MSDVRETKELSGDGSLSDVMDWLENHGFRVIVPSTVQGTHRGAILFAKGREACVQMAMLGDTLVWDGNEITID